MWTGKGQWLEGRSSIPNGVARDGGGGGLTFASIQPLQPIFLNLFNKYRHWENLLKTVTIIKNGRISQSETSARTIGDVVNILFAAACTG